MNPAFFCFLLVQLAVLTLFGCPDLKNKHHFPPAETKIGDLLGQESHVVSVIYYYRYLHSLSEGELEREHAHAKQDLSEKHQPISRLRMGLILGIPQAPFKDYHQSQKFLEDYILDPAVQDPTLKEFLLIVSSYAQELENQQNRRQHLEKDWKDEKKERELLQEKLEELKTIEKSLLERENKTRP
jgi:hypothetical protein